MVIREVPAIGRWSLILGLVLPFIGYSLVDYNSAQSFLWNLQTQHITLPFFHGQNPIACLSDSVRKIIATPFGFSYKPEAGCMYNTIVSFKSVILASLGFLVLGIYFHIRKQEFANLWPTSFTPKEDDGEGENSLPKEDAPAQPKKNINIKYDGPIPPNEGGF